MNVLEATREDEVHVFCDLRRRSRLELERGNFYAEGEQVLLRLLRSSLPIHSVLTTPEFFERWISLFSRKDDVTIWLAGKSWIEHKTGQKWNQPCLAFAKMPDPPPLDQLCTSNATFVALDGIDHAVNVGAIVRNCAALGITGLIADKTSVHPYSFRSVRTSLGGIFELPLFMPASLPEFLNDLRRRFGVNLIAADPHGSVSIAQMDFKRICCLIFGNEHSGITKAVGRLKPERVAIPISGRVDSLNVAAASAIFLHAAALAKSSEQPQ
jgi:tRNA G18 (ribose-2'-O)-methylase SpoU